MRRARLISFFAIGAAACAAIVACSLQDGGVLDLTHDAEATSDGAADTSVPFDSSPPNPDGAIVDAGATFCDLTMHDAGFFFCADFDDMSPTHGFRVIATDGGSVAFGPSDASPPNLFESTLTNANNDTSENALATISFDFPDGGDAGISYLSIAFDLRVNSISLDGAAPQLPSANVFVLLLEQHYAIYLPIVGHANIAPVTEFGTVDLNDGSASIVPVADGGTPVGEWNRIRLQLNVGADGGASTLSVFVNAAMIGTQVVSLSPAVLTSRRLQLFLGPQGKGPLTSQMDYDNVVIRTDKL